MATFSAFVLAATALLGQTKPEQSALPDKIVTELNYFEGHWTVEGDVLGMDLKGRWNAKWAPKKQCLLITYPLSLDGERIFGNGIMGWDSNKQELLVLMFYSNGVNEDVRYKVESPGHLKGIFTGSAEGEAFKAKCQVKTKQPDEWTFQTEGHTRAGKDYGEFSVRFVRLKEKEKGEKK